MTLKNPILPGFHPDPSICRVGDTYYIATSTFEWFPGVEINRSQDLSEWTIVARPLNRASQLDMRGNPDSCGVWAPALSYADDKFWLIYTDVKRYDGNYKDTHNYLVTAPEIEGPWSDPVYLNSSGFDPSLFHDEDGRKWIVNMDWDYRGQDSPFPNKAFAGIVAQEYDAEKQCLFGPVERIFPGSDRGFTEAPHLYKRDGWYHLITAEGGTGYRHVVTHARSRSIFGPYELHPLKHPIASPKDLKDPLQRLGHGQFVEGDDGIFWHTFLCSRPLPGMRRSPLGRETGIVPCRWHEDGWLYPDETGVPTRQDGYYEETDHSTFEAGLPASFQWLRTPDAERIYSTTRRQGWLRLFGRESIGSWFEQALVARRQTAWRYTAETVLEFDPLDYQSQAGLVAYYNRCQFHYLFVSRDESDNRVIAIQSCTGDWPKARLELPVGTGLPVPDGPIRLGMDVDLGELQFRWAEPDGDWEKLGPVLDASVLSDEGGRGEHANFTGTFVGMATQDVGGRGHHADFSCFDYRNRLGVEDA